MLIRLINLKVNQSDRNSSRDNQEQTFTSVILMLLLAGNFLIRTPLSRLDFVSFHFGRFGSFVNFSTSFRRFGYKSKVMQCVLNNLEKCF